MPQVCAFCFQPVDPESQDTYRQVTSWVHGPKLDGPKLREQTGALAHGDCVRKQVAGQAPDQPELFEDLRGDPEATPMSGEAAVGYIVVTDEPGKIIKLTGHDSLHSQIQDRIHKLALQLQSEGPDEYPYDFYLHLAQKEFEERMKRQD